MAGVVLIMGDTGTGKTTSTIINPDGTCDEEFVGIDENGNIKPDNTTYFGMDPETHFIINLDKKPLPIPGHMWNRKKGNMISTSNFEDIKKILIWISKNEKIKSVSLDTLTVYLSIKELNERKMKTYDTWKDIAQDVIELNDICNTLLREDQIAYIFGHTTLETNNNTGEDIERLSIIGKKLKKTPPEIYYTYTLISRIEWGEQGDNTHCFETKADHSTVKVPLGVFKDFRIPNSLKLVDIAVRKHMDRNRVN